VYEQVKVVEVTAFVTEAVQKPEWLVGQVTVRTVVYVQKAVDQELVSVLQELLVDAVWWQIHFVEQHTVDIVDLYVTTVRELGVHVHTAAI
jgi:hypothetical protein